jgi:hypothetical protein
LTTTLNLPTTLVEENIASYSGTAVTQIFAPATDTASLAAGVVGLCGVRIYTIFETIPKDFVKIVSPATEIYTENWTLSMLSNSLDDVGTHTVTL